MNSTESRAQTRNVPLEGPEGELGPYGQEATQLLDIHYLTEVFMANQLGQMEIDASKAHFLNMASHLGYGESSGDVKFRLTVVQKHLSNHSFGDRCVHYLVAYSIPIDDHSYDCEYGDYLKEERAREEEEQRGRERQNAAIEEHMQQTRQLARTIERGWTSDSAVFMSSVTLGVMAEHIRLELAHRHPPPPISPAPLPDMFPPFMDVISIPSAHPSPHGSMPSRAPSPASSDD